MYDVDDGYDGCHCEDEPSAIGEFEELLLNSERVSAERLILKS